MIQFSCSFILVFLLNLIPCFFSQCEENSYKNQYDKCYYDKYNFPILFFGGGNIAALISRCTFTDIAKNQFLGGTRDCFVEHTVLNPPIIYFFLFLGVF
jgi:hypothetical protein